MSKHKKAARAGQAAQPSPQPLPSRKAGPATQWVLDKLDSVAVAGYALVAGPWWSAAIDGTLTAPNGALLTLSTLALGGVWAIIGYAKAKSKE